MKPVDSKTDEIHDNIEEVESNAEAEIIKTEEIQKITLQLYFR